jgi:endonuclease/exonuclease/phosphatase family metal-dependent hydrolase
MGKLREELIFGVLTPVDEDEWINDPQAVIEEVAKNRKLARLDDEDTAEEFERLLAENAIADDEEIVRAELPAPKATEQLPEGLRSASVCSAYYHGRRTTPRCRDALWCLNQILQNGHGERSDMSMVQGSCSTSVGASAGTHAGGDAGDLTRYNQSNRVKYGRLIGFNIHYRPAIRNLWSEHVHFTMLKSSTVSAAAQNQNNVWYARYGNGLANGGRATGFLPNSREIKFIRKDVATWRANKNTKGYAEPGSDWKVNREAGWIFESIGVVEVGNRRYLFNETPTFYPIDDFNHWINDWVIDGQTYQVVKETQGYEKMWSDKAPNTLRKPGYIIKTVGRTTKAPVGVATENGVFYRQSDLKKVDNKYSNENPPKKDEPVTPEPVKIDTGIYEVTANPSLWGLRNPGLGNEKVGSPAPKGTELRGTHSQVVAGDKWIQAHNDLWYHSYYLKQTGEQPILVEPTPEPEPEPEEPKVVPPKPVPVEDLLPDVKPVEDLLPEDVPIEAHSAEWRVVADNKEGTIGPGGTVASVRPKGYHLFTTQKAIHEDTVYYISYLGYWYSADGLLPWDVPDTPVPEPEIEPEPPEPTPVPVPVPVPPTPAPPKPPSKEKFVVKAGTQNIQRWRLETRPMGHAPWHRGSSYATRMELFAIEVKNLGLDIIGTQEAGRYVDRDVLSNALSKATGKKWAGILHGDNGDITMGVHWNTAVYTLRKEGSIKSYGSTHNKHTYVKLEHRETGRPLWVVSCHLRYGKGFKNHRVRQMKDIVEGAWKLADKDPIVFVGDFNNNSRDRDAVSKAMSRNGYNKASSKFGKLKDTLNGLETKVSRATQVYDNLYWHKSRKILKAGVHAKINNGRYVKPFVADHNCAWAYLEV